MIPMVDLKRQYDKLKVEIDEAIARVLNSTQFILGPQVEMFEKEVAAYHGLPHAIGVANGTDALLLALRALGIGRGDEVITTPFTFIATAEVISLLGARPVFADICPITFNIDPARIVERITKKTKAIIPVHLFGHPAEMERINEIAIGHRLPVIEDCAQAFGASIGSRKVGAFGAFGCFSFFPSKNLAGYGDGGMIITGDSDLAREVRILRNHGSEKRYHHHTVGYNSRLDEIQAAILRVKLKRIDEMNHARRLNAEGYRSQILREEVIVPAELAGYTHVFHQFTLKVKDRARFVKSLAEHQCASAIYYPIPLHRQEVYKAAGLLRGGLRVSEACAAEVLSVPMFPELTQQEIARVCRAVNNA